MIMLRKVIVFFLVITIIIIQGCNMRYKQIKRSGIDASFTNLVIQSRKQELRKKWQETKTQEYQTLKKHQRWSLLYLFDLYVDVMNKGERINIIENYDANSNRYSGVIWGRDTIYSYTYDVNLKCLAPLDTISDFTDYSRNPDIHENLIKFYTSFSWKDGFKNFPASGRSNNGYYIYTQALLGEGLIWDIKSIAMKQW